MSKGVNHRRKNAIKALLKLGTETASRMADAIWDKLKRRGEWKVKTKRSLSKSQAISKSKKGKSSSPKENKMAANGGEAPNGKRRK